MSVQPGLRGSNDLRVDEKWRFFNYFFLVQRTGGSPTGPDLENRVRDQDIGSSGRPGSSALQVPGVLQFPVGGFPSKCPSIAPAEINNTPR